MNTAVPQNSVIKSPLIVASKPPESRDPNVDLRKSSENNPPGPWDAERPRSPGVTRKSDEPAVATKGALKAPGTDGLPSSSGDLGNSLNGWGPYLLGGTVVGVGAVVVACKDPELVKRALAACLEGLKSTPISTILGGLISASTLTESFRRSPVAQGTRAVLATTNAVIAPSPTNIAAAVLLGGQQLNKVAQSCGYKGVTMPEQAIEFGTGLINLGLALQDPKASLFGPALLLLGNIDPSVRQSFAFKAANVMCTGKDMLTSPNPQNVAATTNALASALDVTEIKGLSIPAMMGLGTALTEIGANIVAAWRVDQQRDETRLDSSTEVSQAKPEDKRPTTACDGPMAHALERKQAIELDLSRGQGAPERIVALKKQLQAVNVELETLRQGQTLILTHVANLQNDVDARHLNTKRHFDNLRKPKQEALETLIHNGRGDIALAKRLRFEISNFDALEQRVHANHARVHVEKMAAYEQEDRQTVAAWNRMILAAESDLTRMRQGALAKGKDKSTQAEVKRESDIERFRVSCAETLASRAKHRLQPIVPREVPDHDVQQSVTNALAVLGGIPAFTNHPVLGKLGAANSIQLAVRNPTVENLASAAFYVGMCAALPEVQVGVGVLDCLMTLCSFPTCGDALALGMKTATDTIKNADPMTLEEFMTLPSES